MLFPQQTLSLKQDIKWHQHQTLLMKQRLSQVHLQEQLQHQQHQQQHQQQQRRC